MLRTFTFSTCTLNYICDDTNIYLIHFGSVLLLQRMINCVAFRVWWDCSGPPPDPVIGLSIRILTNCARIWVRDSIVQNQHKRLTVRLKLSDSDLGRITITSILILNDIAHQVWIINSRYIKICETAHEFCIKGKTGFKFLTFENATALQQKRNYKRCFDHIIHLAKEVETVKKNTGKLEKIHWTEQKCSKYRRSKGKG